MNFRIKAVYVLVCCVLLSACEVGEKIDEYNMGNDVFFYVLKKDNKLPSSLTKSSKTLKGTPQVLIAACSFIISLSIIFNMS